MLGRVGQRLGNHVVRADLDVLRHPLLGEHVYPDRNRGAPRERPEGGAQAAAGQNGRMDAARDLLHLFQRVVGARHGVAELGAQFTKPRRNLRLRVAQPQRQRDQARQRIEHDLHDGAQQRLVSLALQLRDAQAAVPPGLGELRAQLGRAVDSANDTLDEVREIARGIHPAVLASGGLRPAIRALARRSAVPVRLGALAEQRLPEHVEVSAYYVVAEALTNAARHARASAVSIRVEVGGELLCVAVTDDGVGGAAFGGGTGLVGLKDRVEALGGRLRLDSPDGGGTSVTAELPITTVGVSSARPDNGRK